MIKTSLPLSFALAISVCFAGFSSAFDKGTEGDLSNGDFGDGGFEQIAKISRGLAAHPPGPVVKLISALFVAGAAQDIKKVPDLYKGFPDANSIFLISWNPEGNVRLVTDRGNALVELTAEGGRQASIGPGVILSELQDPSAIEFDLMVLQGSPARLLEVTLKDGLKDSPRGVYYLLGTYFLKERYPQTRIR